MKYAQEYDRILRDSGFPLEWRESAIGYRQLKKLIKKVEGELSGLGLNPVVLNKLLNPANPHDAPTDSESDYDGSGPSGSNSAVDEIEFEFSSDSSDEELAALGKQRNKGSDLLGVPAERRGRTWSDGHGKRFRLRVKEGGSGTGTGSGSGGEGSGSMSESYEDSPQRHHHFHEGSHTHGISGFQAEYELGGNSSHPVPRIRLRATPTHSHIQSPLPEQVLSPSSDRRMGSSAWSANNRASFVPSDMLIPSTGEEDSSIQLSKSLPNRPILSNFSEPPPGLSGPSSLASTVSSANKILRPVLMADCPSNDTDDTSVADLPLIRSPKQKTSPNSAPLMASSPRYFLGSAPSPIWALQSGAEEGMEGLKLNSPLLSPMLYQRNKTPKQKYRTPEQIAEQKKNSEEMEALFLPEGEDLDGEDDDYDDDDDAGSDVDVEDNRLATPRERRKTLVGRGEGMALPFIAVQGSPRGSVSSGESLKTVKKKNSPDEATLSAGTMAPPALNDTDAALASEVLETPGVQADSAQPKEFFIELASDIEFFNVLTDALDALDKLQRTQQAIFRKTVDELCKTISRVAAPPSKRSAEKSTSLIRGSAGGSYSDLYAWREVFTLWIEAEIFESSSERDRIRGTKERPIEIAEARLKAFAGEVVRRGLGDRRTLKSKESRDALSTFLQLNLTLLDLKKFQTANIQAARKILKKHDKRTALMASSSFPQFVRSSLEGEDNNIRTWTLFDASLPHVLLSCLTETLLPIIPSLEDYACAICTSIAFKPIRLDCSHLFCVRCLAKMQMAGKTECPLCRAPVLGTATGKNLDMAAMQFMKDYFPKEVKVKQRENEKEVAEEVARDMGVHNGKCHVQ